MSIIQQGITQKYIIQNLGGRRVAAIPTIPVDYYFRVRADKVVVDGSNYIESALDFSENGYDPSQFIQVSKPLYVANGFNGRPIMRFDGTNDYLSVSFGTSYTAPITVFLVHQCTATSGANIYLFDNLNTSSGLCLYNYGSILGTSASLRYTKAKPYPNPIITCLESNDTSSILYEDGVQQDTGTNTITSSDSLALGAYYGLSYYYKGDIAEMIMYNRLLTAAEKLQVTGNLKFYYGIS